MKEEFPALSDRTVHICQLATKAVCERVRDGMKTVTPHVRSRSLSTAVKTETVMAMPANRPDLVMEVPQHDQEG